MVHNPIAIMILPIFVTGILMLGILAAAANAQENNTTGNAAAPEVSNNTGNAAAPEASNNTGNAAAPEASNNTGNASTSQQSNNTDFVNTILKIHNHERALVGVPPLAWSDKLAADAKTEAEYLVTVGKLTHEGCSSCNGSGNLAQGGTGSSTEQLMQGWVDEKAKWHSGTILTEANWYPTGHYTQMVWKTTTHIGCATASGGGSVYLSCHYSPPGNYMGESPY
jgi:uncharacterized protein YkwD